MMKSRVNKRVKWERILGITALITFILAAFAGFNRSVTDVSPHLEELYGEADSYRQVDFETYAAIGDSAGIAIGYVTVHSSNGFGGPMKVATAVDDGGRVVSVKVLEHRETPSWFQRVMDNNFIPQLAGKAYLDPFALKKDVQAITGATYTTRAIAESVKAGARDIAVTNFGLSPPKEAPKHIKFGLPEIALLLLLGVATFAFKHVPPQHKNKLHWVIALAGMGIIGFMANHQLTLVDLNKFLMGFWPDLHNQLYWYILVFGVVLLLLTTNKNSYCQHVCPFGAAQECAALIGNAKGMHSKKFHYFFKWLRRTVVWLAIIFGLLYRNPGISSYEVYSTLFSLSGTNREVLFLGIVLVCALFIKRPWCTYLCPMAPVEEFIRMMKRWGKEVVGKSAVNTNART